MVNSLHFDQLRVQIEKKTTNLSLSCFWAIIRWKIEL